MRVSLYFSIALVLIVAACSEPPVDLAKLQFRGDQLYYLPNTEVPFTGKAVEYYPDSDQMKTEGKYRGGKLHGDFKAWHENGELQRQGRYVDGVLEGPYVEWTETGQPTRVGSMKNGRFSGLLTGYSEKGQKSYELTIVSDVRDGPAKRWFSDGQLAFQGAYRNDERHGKWTFWTGRGEIESEKVFEDGEVISVSEPSPNDIGNEKGTGGAESPESQ